MTPEAAAVIPDEKVYTFADYEKLPEGAPYTLIGGALVMTPSPVPLHQIISRRIETVLSHWVEKNNLGEVLDAPIDVRLSDTETYQPDIIFIAKDNTGIIGKKYITGAPDLVIEILSPSTAYYDLRHKKDIYQKSGVKEYWIVDPMESTIEIYENTKGGYVETAKAQKTGHIQSKYMPGFGVDLEKTFEWKYGK